MYPLNSIPFNKKDPLCRLSAEWLNTVSNMLSGLQIVMVDGQDYAEVVAPTQQGDNWKFKIPSAGATNELTVVTDVQFDGINLQKKTRKVKVLFVEAEEESAWTTIVGGTAESCET